MISLVSTSIIFLPASTSIFVDVFTTHLRVFGANEKTGTCDICSGKVQPLRLAVQVDGCNLYHYPEQDVEFIRCSLLAI